MELLQVAINECSVLIQKTEKAINCFREVQRDTKSKSELTSYKHTLVKLNEELSMYQKEFDKLTAIMESVKTDIAKITISCN